MIQVFESPPEVIHLIHDSKVDSGILNHVQNHILNHALIAYSDCPYFQRCHGFAESCEIKTSPVVLFDCDRRYCGCGELLASFGPSGSSIIPWKVDKRITETKFEVSIDSAYANSFTISRIQTSPEII